MDEVRELAPQRDALLLRIVDDEDEVPALMFALELELTDWWRYVMRQMVARILHVLHEELNC